MIKLAVDILDVNKIQSSDLLETRDPVPALQKPTPFSSREEVTRALSVTQETWRKAHRRFPIRWPRYYLDLARHEQIARIGRPTSREWREDIDDLSDPIADQRLRPIPFVVRKHPDRVIILATKKCHFYCRFCFRREEPVAKQAEPSWADWERIFDYLTQNPEINEPILSGGDPLTLTDPMLFRIRDALASIASVKKWRIHTRAPVHFPQRVTPDLPRELARGLPLRIVTHYNHHREITDETQRIANLMAENGIEYKNQAVLLAGVNDRLEDQLLLWRGLADLGIKPHYLHHPDRVPGNAAFRVTIQRGVALYRRLSDSLANCPAYVIDLPDGRGKAPVMDFVQKEKNIYQYSHPDGAISTYHDLAQKEPDPADRG